MWGQEEQGTERPGARLPGSSTERTSSRAHRAGFRHAVGAPTPQQTLRQSARATACPMTDGPQCLHTTQVTN